jgi:hypothetical protein
VLRGALFLFSKEGRRRSLTQPTACPYTRRKKERRGEKTKNRTTPRQRHIKKKEKKETNREGKRVYKQAMQTNKTKETD